MIGGGATGLGVAVDAASRGYRTLLFEAEDFGCGTSSRSTKLIHGGVRYLRQGNLRLVHDALRERAILLRNAPDFVQEIPFVVPARGSLDFAKLVFGFSLYDFLAGSRGLAKSRRLSKDEALARVPALRVEGLRGGVLYHDARFDDARLAIQLARTAVREGATLINGTAVRAIEHSGAEAPRVVVRDRESSREIEVAARVVVNAAGPSVDAVRRLADPNRSRMLAPSRGSHLVLDRAAFPGDAALLIPDVGDGRVVFLIPWGDRVLLGTTDVAVAPDGGEPSASRAEMEQLLALAARVLERPPAIADVRSVFAGLRPLLRGEGSTASLPRDHVVRVEDTLVTIAGGKWTTYRLMAEAAVDHAAAVGELPARPCRTATLPIEPMRAPQGATPLDAHTDVTREQVERAAREEMARTVEDVLARRTGTLPRDARLALRLAPAVAGILAKELGRDADWERGEVERFERVAARSLPETLC